VEVYHEALAADGTLLYVLANDGGVINGAPAALDGRPLLEPYPALEVCGLALLPAIPFPGGIATSSRSAFCRCLLLLAAKSTSITRRYFL